MSDIIDRRENTANKSAVNSQRFLHRYRAQMQRGGRAGDRRPQASPRSTRREHLDPRPRPDEPTFQHGAGGRREGVHPGNKEFVTGDEIPRPQGGGKGMGSGASR